MSDRVKQRTARGAHARIAAEEQRTGSKTGLLVLVIVFIALVAILLRLAEFSGRHIQHSPVRSAPGVVLLDWRL